MVAPDTHQAKEDRHADGSGAVDSELVAPPVLVRTCIATPIPGQ